VVNWAKQAKAVEALGNGDRGVRFLTQHVSSAFLTRIKCRGVNRPIVDT
jgi:hypothetical protein